MKGRRSHSKISTYPPELVDAINQKIVEGMTYRQIADWLSQKGQEISHTAVANYGKTFLSKLEQLKVVKEQAKAIVTESGDAPATEMAEAANQLAIQMIMETLMDAEKGVLQKEKLSDVLKALAQLEKSSVARENLKMQFNKGYTKAIAHVKDELKKELENRPDLLEEINKLISKVEEKMKGSVADA